ncbi:hypothetical protein BV898_01148 [Hypsibius exemplaris]|uniref:Gustatory receptor n=1 Tax=Hypsibius exemplaris TaxID=2072580 RepID=A0A1W0XC09_HYPEX|nr:hypothetical protein BV898_01148 [Hypsibius exemplaris]
MAKKFKLIQLNFLQIIRFIPCNDVGLQNRPIYRTLTLAIAWCILLGSLVCVGFTFLQSIAALLQENDLTLVAKLFLIIPFFITSLQTFIVLILAIYQRASLKKLHQFVENFIAEQRLSNGAKNRTKRWRLQATILFVCITIFTSLWYTWQIEMLITYSAAAEAGTTGFKPLPANLQIGMYVILQCFFFYITVFLAPLIFVHEQNAAISRSIDGLIDALELRSPSSTKTDTKNLIKRLQSFENRFRTLVCTFDGAGLLPFTRGFVVGTCTVALSLLFLAKELLDNATKDDCCTGATARNSSPSSSIAPWHLDDFLTTKEPR